MEGFINFLLNEDKSRFIKKNKNLTREQQQIVIDFFDEHEQAVKRNYKTKVDWNKSANMTWEDFERIMSITRSSPSALKAKARKLRHQGVAGLKEGEDYVYVKTKNKAFLCYIPLNYRANQVIFSSHIGGVKHDGCIGSSQAKQYYKSEAVRRGLVPVVVVGESKDTVMVMKDNKHWELWDSCNNRKSNSSRPFINKELIPDFSIKKELMTNKLAGLYDWVRSEIWGTGVSGKYTEEEYDDAVDAYDSLASDIDNYFERYDEASQYGRDEIHRIINATIEEHREKAEEIMDNFKAEYGEAKTGMDRKEITASNRIAGRVKQIRTAMSMKPNGTDINDAGEPVWHISGVETPERDRRRDYADRKENIRNMELSGSNLVPYTRSELEAFLDYAEDNYIKTPEEDISVDEQEWADAELEAKEEAYEYSEVADNLDKLLSDGEYYEVYEYNRGSGNDWLDDVDWSEDIPSDEYDWTEDVYSPHIQSDTYAPYFDFNQEHGSGDDISDDYGLDESIREAVHNQGESGSGILEYCDFLHPENIVENIQEEE